MNAVYMIFSWLIKNVCLWVAGGGGGGGWRWGGGGKRIGNQSCLNSF